MKKGCRVQPAHQTIHMIDEVQTETDHRDAYIRGIYGVSLVLDLSERRRLYNYDPTNALCPALAVLSDHNYKHYKLYSYHMKMVSISSVIRLALRPRVLVFRHQRTRALPRVCL